MRDCCQTSKKGYFDLIKEDPTCNYANADVKGGAQIESPCLPCLEIVVHLTSVVILHDTKISFVHPPTIATAGSKPLLEPRASCIRNVISRARHQEPIPIAPSSPQSFDPRKTNSHLELIFFQQSDIPSSPNRRIGISSGNLASPSQCETMKF